jgi:hypothetical protein
MNGELWKLKDDAPPPPVINRTRRLVFVGLLGLLLIGGVTFALLVRAKPSQNPSPVYDPTKPRGLKLFDAKVTFAIEPIQTVDLRLPCSGLLTINVNFPEKTTLNVFLVSFEEREKMKARQIFAHLDGFDGRTSSGSYQQAAPLPPGRYCLVLLDESKSRTVVEVSAQLSDLK